MVSDGKLIGKQEKLKVFCDRLVIDLLLNTCVIVIVWFSKQCSAEVNGNMYIEQSIPLRLYMHDKLKGDRPTFKRMLHLQVIVWFCKQSCRRIF